jgi:hypothetical protein
MEDNKPVLLETKAIDQDKILKTVIKEIEKTYGKGFIMKLRDKNKPNNWSVVFFVKNYKMKQIL